MDLLDAKIQVEKPALKKGGGNFSSRQCTCLHKCFVDGGYFADLPELHFNDGIKLFKKCWNKCIEVFRRLHWKVKLISHLKILIVILRTDPINKECFIHILGYVIN